MKKGDYDDKKACGLCFCCGEDGIDIRYQKVTRQTEGNTDENPTEEWDRDDTKCLISIVSVNSGLASQNHAQQLESRRIGHSPKQRQLQPNSIRPLPDTAKSPRVKLAIPAHMLIYDDQNFRHEAASSENLTVN